MSIRVLVVDDFGPFRRYLVGVLSEQPGFQIVGEVADGLTAVQKANELKPDLILLDIGLPSMNGIEAARHIRNVSPESKILFVTEQSLSAIVREALSTGAHGYLVKSHAANELLPALKAVLSGAVFISACISFL